MIIEIKRGKDNGIQILGNIRVKDITGCTIFQCKSLELSYKDNKKNISSIPKGSYEAEIYNSPSKWNKETGNKVILLKNVPNRSYIEIHSGNYYTQLEGCILPGVNHIDIDGDGQKDVTSSAITLKRLIDIVEGNKFKVNIL